MVRALPAHQRLPSGQLQAVQAVFGLDVDLEFPVAQGPAHAHFQFLFTQYPDAHAGIIEVPRLRALGLDGLQGNIGAVQQIVDAGGRVAVLRAADARAQFYMVAPGLGTRVSIERPQQRVTIGRQVLLFVVGKQNHEMIPVHPRRKRAGAGQLAQEESKALQQRISDIVAQHLVDDLEVQDVKGQHGVVRRVGGLQQRVAVDFEFGEVPDAGERVRKGQGPDFPLIAALEAAVDEKDREQSGEKQSAEQQRPQDDGIGLFHYHRIGDDRDKVPAFHIRHRDVAEDVFAVGVVEHGHAGFAVLQGVAEGLNDLWAVAVSVDNVEETGKGFVAGRMQRPHDDFAAGQGHIGEARVVVE